MVLAAGKGTRLRPLTRTLPKPLLPVGERVLVERTLDQLEAAGITEVAINLHHLGDQIRQYLGGSYNGMAITWSPEPELLGTLGALTNLREFLAPAALVVAVNGDSLCEWPVSETVATHQNGGALATLLVSTTAVPDDFGGGIGVKGGRVTRFRQPAPDEARVFAGLQVFDPEILSEVPMGPRDTVQDLYQPALDEGATIAAHTTDRPWFDLGTPRRYLEAVLAACAADGEGVVACGAVVDDSADVMDSLVMNGALVGPSARLRRTIVGPGVEVVAGGVWESVMLTQDEDGSLVSTPID